MASLKGNFTFQYNPRTAVATEAKDGGIGIFSFDGKGNVKSSETIMYDGKLQTGTDTFTYTVDSDGIGAISTTGKGPHFAFALHSVAAGQAEGLQFLDTYTSDGTGNLVITGSALKQ